MTVIAVVVAMAVYLLSVTQGGATLMSNVTGLDYNICVLLAVLLFTIMVIAAGSKGVLITDTIMFGLFTTIGVVSVIIVSVKAGGWWNIIEDIAANPETSYLLSWSGKLGYLYDTGLENVIYFLAYGICWAGVAFCGPWQCSRNIMAKSEHTVIRSAVWVVIGCFGVNYLVELGAVFMHAFDIGDTEATQVWLWAAGNVLPTIIGVVLVTGIIAAAISSSTTFLSLIGASISNDIFRIKDSKKNVLVSRVSMLLVAAIVLVVAITNPPNIWWIMQIGADSGNLRHAPGGYCKCLEQEHYQGRGFRRYVRRLCRQLHYEGNHHFPGHHRADLLRRIFCRNSRQYWGDDDCKPPDQGDAGRKRAERGFVHCSRVGEGSH